MKLYSKAAVTLSLACACLFSGCASIFHSEPPLTQLQLREIQTREFATKDLNLVMKSMMNVLQDENFILKNVVMDAGLLSAEQQNEIPSSGWSILARGLLGPEMRWDKHSITEISANVTPHGDKMRVRVNFQRKTLDNRGNMSKSTTIQDPILYQVFFEKVGKGIFLQEQEV